MKEPTLEHYDKLIERLERKLMKYPEFNTLQILKINRLILSNVLHAKIIMEGQEE